MTPPFIETLLLVPLCSIMAYLFPVCVLDIKYREVNPFLWAPLLIVNVPVMVYLYVSEWYPWYCFLISLVTCGIFYAIWKTDLLQGADYLFLSFIALFWIVNPHNPWPHGIQIQFYFYLLATMAVTAVLVFIYNVWSDRKGTWIQMLQDYPRGIPFMLPISLAFVLSYFLG